MNGDDIKWIPYDFPWFYFLELNSSASTILHPRADVGFHLIGNDAGWWF